MLMKMKEIISLLKKEQIRITPQRQEMLSILKKSETALDCRRNLQLTGKAVFICQYYDCL